MMENPENVHLLAPMLSMSDVKEVLSVKSDATVRAMVRDGTFPPPVRVRNASRWPARLIAEWQAKQVRDALERQAAGIDVFL